MWRYRATGIDVATALGDESLRDARLDVRLNIGEARLVTAAAQARGIGTRSYVKRALGTMLVVCEGVPAEELPSMLKGGLVRPR
jgi:hypothetical protein